MTTLNRTATGKLLSSSDCSNSMAVKTTQVFELFDNLYATYTPSEVMLSFNGGKDCTVVLHLLHSYIKTREKLKDLVIPVLYIQPKCPFQEVEEFILECERTYCIELIREKGEIKTVVQKVADDRPHVKAFIMGVRRTDPNSINLEHMQPTDSSWPPLLRVNPILDWRLRDIWTYLRENKVNYCCLYDMGYTSVGDVTNTRPNEHLKVVDDLTGEVTYRPAYELVDDEFERSGR